MDPHGQIAINGRSPALSLLSLDTTAASLIALAATYALSLSDLDFASRSGGFVLIVLVYISSCVYLYFRQARGFANEVRNAVQKASSQRCLDSLDEAANVFGGSLSLADAFRLVASRIAELVPVRSTALYILDEARADLVCVNADGPAADIVKNKRLTADEGTSGRAFSRRDLVVESGGEARASIASIPLLNGPSVFGVIELGFVEGVSTEGVDRIALEAVGTRAAPLLLAALARDRSRVNALTDPTTDLPNERAFYLVLENQTAEAQRRRGERDLTVLAVDIKNFDDVNRMYGHAAGDRILTFVARTVKDALRQMDFIARAQNDEFLIILPTVDPKDSREIIDRIQTGFVGQRLAITESQTIEIELNIGWAAFGTDGETPSQLLGLAQLRKEQMKSVGAANVLRFPQDAGRSVH